VPVPHNLTLGSCPNITSGLPLPDHNLGGCIRAQVDRAVLEGTATDATGAVIRGANVQVLAVDTGSRQEQLTNSNGYYRFPGLAVGQYTVTVTNPKFTTKVIDDVVVQVGQTRTLNIRLEVGGVEEKVEVNASAEPADRSSAEASTVIYTEQIANLPNNGRDWASFTLFAPFAHDDGGGDQRTIRFAGRARDDNNFQIDGVDAGGIQEQAQKSQTRLQISQDAIEEYRVNSALYDAEYGTQAGGQVDIVTKSGTNDFHGTVFGYSRNSVFDARNFNGNITRFGDAGNGLLRAPDSWQIDLGLTKETKLTERFSMEFAVQAFNILNHVQLGDPGTLSLVYDPSASSTGFLTNPGNFGVITSTVNFNNNNDNKASPNTGTGLPRQLQFILRFVF
jgi:hypothetical protein